MQFNRVTLRLLAILAIAMTSGLMVRPGRAQQTDTSALKVVSTQTLDLIAGPGNRAARLSPDGTQFAYFDGKTLCFYTIAGTKGVCTDDLQAQKISINPESITWSPDGSQIAFSEQFFLYFVDSDIWLVDAKTGKLTDRTPAPNRDKRFFSAQTDKSTVFTADVSPQFSADGTTIYFLRYVFTETVGNATPQLFKAALGDTSEPTKAATLIANAVSTYAFAVSPDGSRLVYNSDPNMNNFRLGGTILAKADGSDTQVALAAKQSVDLPYAYQFSSDGKYALAHVINTEFTTVAKPNGSATRIIPTDGGAPLPVDTETYVSDVGWSPTGHAVAYTTLSGLTLEEKPGLFIVDEPGKPGRLLLEGKYRAPMPRGISMIGWGSNNTILLASGDDQKLVVITLG